MVGLETRSQCVAQSDLELEIGLLCFQGLGLQALLAFPDSCSIFKNSWLTG